MRSLVLSILLGAGCSASEVADGSAAPAGGGTAGGLADSAWGEADGTNGPMDGGGASPGDASGDGVSAGDGGGFCGPGWFCVAFPGLVIAPTPGNDQFSKSMKVPPGTYHRLHASLTVKHGGWTSPSVDASRYAVLYLARSKPFDMFSHLMFTRPTGVRLRHGFGMKPPDKPKLEMTVPFVIHDTYGIDYDYDTVAPGLKLVISHESEVLGVLEDKPNTTSIQFATGDTLDLFLGFVEGENPQEGASYGWEYRDLEIQLAP